ncbi:MAG: sulfite exporter TauE/SafE family protein [Fimbriimonadaceae bacterium]|nr:sulfite exporter TauE/SafE family protein [Fimbriimonadaceae bacterium]
MADLSLWFVAGIAVIAMIYSMVGHGGASGYLGLLAISPLLPKQIAVIALTINLVVAGTSFVLYSLAKHFNWRLTWPFLIGSLPLAFVGSIIKLTDTAYFTLVGLTLLIAGVRLLFIRKHDDGLPTRPSSVPVGIAAGAGIGLLSGMVGVGGGIFLSPILVLHRWATAKETSASSAIFIVANSAIGLAGRISQGATLPNQIWVFAFAGLCGSLVGSYVGAFAIPNTTLRRALACVLIFAAVKLALK